MKMIQRRTKPHVVSMAKPAHRKSVQSVDHWAFLDEIEAPMWADLDLEATSGPSGFIDTDDNWFDISHPVHQCSSRKLKSALSHAGEAKTHVGSGLKGSLSPKLPPSVSRSRGKNFKSKEWTHSITNKQHPIKNLNAKSSWVDSGSDKKLKSKPSNDNGKETVRSKTTSVCESSLTESCRFNSLSLTATTGELKTNSNSSTITHESGDKQRLKFSEVSTQASSQTSGVFSELNLTLRKSCAPRQALRVENVGGRQPRGRNSSSGKSSVGSSSHPGYDAGNAIGVPTLKSKDATPDSRNVNRIMPSANLDKVIGLNTSKKTNAETLATRCRSKTSATKSAHEETAKLKIVNPKVMRLRRGNEYLGAVTNTNDKTETRRYNRLGNGKENAKIKTRAGLGELVQIQKVKRPNVPPKTDKPGLTGPKVKICSRDEKKSSTSVTKNIHFR